MDVKCNMCKSFGKDDAQKWCHIDGCPHKEEVKEDTTIDEDKPLVVEGKKGKGGKVAKKEEPIIPEPSTPASPEGSSEVPVENQSEESGDSKEIQESPIGEEKISDESAV